jgi:serine/threonine protein kinase
MYRSQSTRRTASVIESSKPDSKYDFAPGRILARKYEVLSHVTSTEDGELYRLCEKATGIERTAKFFYHDGSQKKHKATIYAKKLHKLRNCKILMHYRTQETVSISGIPISFVVWDQLSGLQLDHFLEQQKNGKLSVFEGLHLLHALVMGLDAIHAMSEYHGNITPENIIVKRKGIGFQVKLINMSLEDLPVNRTITEDVVNLVRIFSNFVTPPKHSAKIPDGVKLLYNNFKPARIGERFRNAGALKRYLETMLWS